MNTKSLYQLHLEKSGFVNTRALDLDKAIKDLHLAICQIDFSSGQKEALKNLLAISVADLISEFGTIEELKKNF